MRDSFFDQPPQGQSGPGARWDSSYQTVGNLGTEVKMPLYWTRIAAGLIDYGVPFAIYWWLYTLSVSLGVLGEVIVVGSLIANNIVLQGKTGSSVGKKLFGMKIAYMVGDVRASTAYFAQVSMARTAVRQFCHFIDCVFIWGWIRPWWNRAHRTYAESCTRTVVVQDKTLHLWSMEDIDAHRRGGM